jgi:UDP-glucose 4-epimerase
MSDSVLVVGGAGFIGTNLVKALVKKGHKIIVLDNEFLGSFHNLIGIKCKRVHGNAKDMVLLEKIIRANNVKQVYYLGGYSSAPMFNKDADKKILECYRIFMNVLELAHKYDIKIVYASTSSFYSRCKKPFREDMVIRPGTPYELMKYGMEQIAHMYYLQYGINVNGLRFFSVYGPYEKYKGRYANNLSQFLWSIKHDVNPVIFGDGTQSRDFTFVEDLVEAIILVMQKGAGSDVYNVGTGKEHSFNQMIKLINKKLGKNVQPKYIPNPLKNYVYSTLADISKIKKEIGWTPTTTLEQGIQKIIDFDEDITKEDVIKLYEHLN